MLKSIEATGNNVDSAINSALLTLGKERDDVTVEIIEKAKAGFLGIGAQPAKVRVSYEVEEEATISKKALDFLGGMLTRFGTEAKLEMRVDEEESAVYIDIAGDDMGAVIGRRGDTLDALQYLTSIVSNRGQEKRYHIILDAENYRAKRRATLEKLAVTTAQKAIKYKRSMSLDPMNPQERRVIHATLQEYSGVSTRSTGNEPNRKVVILPDGIREPRQSAGHVPRSR